MPTSFSDFVINPDLWRFMGFGSSIVGFSSFALGPSFQKLFGQWNLFKIVLYFIMSFMFSVFMLLVKYIRRRFPKVFWLKALVCFGVLLLTSLYSYYEDRSKPEKGYRSILSLISFGAFALMSMSLSTQVQPGFEVGMSNFFLGCLVLGVMKKNFMVGLGVAVLCFLVMSIRNYSDFRQEQRPHGDMERNGIAREWGSSHEETSILSSPSIHPSDPIHRRQRDPLQLTRPVNSNIHDPYDSDDPDDYDSSSPFIPTPLRQINFSALRYMSLSDVGFLSFLSSGLLNFFTVRLVQPLGGLERRVRTLMERRGERRDGEEFYESERSRAEENV